MWIFSKKSENTCPTNPDYCMTLYSACDGRKTCKDICSGPTENFPYFNKSRKICLDSASSYCGRRQGAKYQNNQCVLNTKMKGYKCLNRGDINENIIKRVQIFGNANTKRKNLFEILQTNKVYSIHILRTGWPFLLTKGKNVFSFIWARVRKPPKTY